MFWKLEQQSIYSIFYVKVLEINIALETPSMDIGMYMFLFIYLFFFYYYIRGYSSRAKDNGKKAR